MKTIFSLLMALTILAGANAEERLTFSRKPFFTKAPIAVVADKAPAQLAGQPLILYAIRYISMIGAISLVLLLRKSQAQTTTMPSPL